jgi:galactokinase
VGSGSVDGRGREVTVAAALHRTTFGREATAFASAPGRVNLIGEHTDYNAGFVLPMAIDRRCETAGSLGQGQGRCEIISTLSGEVVRFDIGDAAMKRRGWGAYAAGVLAELAAGRPMRDLRIAVASDVPPGSGLSSSASFEVAVGALAAALWGVEVGGMDLARACRRAEHAYAGVPCGLMDQAISVLAREGHAMMLDCRDESVKHVPMPPRDRARVLVVNTNVMHSLGDGAYAARVASCQRAAAALGVASLREADEAALRKAERAMSDEELRRARHVVTENDRTTRACAMLERGEVEGFGRLMNESHQSLKTDYEVSCDELDFVVERAAAVRGVLGARMTGGGFGGCAIVLATPEGCEGVGAVLPAAYRTRFGRDCTLLESGAGAGVRTCGGPGY